MYAGSPQISTLVCSQALFYQNSSIMYISIPYNGGNGETYGATASIASTGLTGFIATLIPGTLNQGGGDVVFEITGGSTSISSNTAIFDLLFLGKNCIISVTLPTISSLNCSSFKTEKNMC